MYNNVNNMKNINMYVPGNEHKTSNSLAAVAIADKLKKIFRSISLDILKLSFKDHKTC